MDRAFLVQTQCEDRSWWTLAAFYFLCDAEAWANARSLSALGDTWRIVTGTHPEPGPTVTPPLDPFPDEDGSTGREPETTAEETDGPIAGWAIL